MKLEACRDPLHVARACADRLEAVVRARPEAVLVLPAGATPRPLFAELVRRARGGLDLRRAHIFQLDELVGLPPQDPRSFHDLLRKELLVPLGHPAARTHLLDGGAVDPAAEIARHAQELVRHGGADLVILGLGRNGHVAFNEPGSTLESPARLLALDATTVDGLNGTFSPGEVPAHGITLGLREIQASREVHLLVTGAAKAEILHAVLAEPPSPRRPASLLLAHAQLIVLADEAARRRSQPAR
ncbi:MAG: glucosamine-6-phosphate deaminase [Planctomycetota bacterium]